MFKNVWDTVCALYQLCQSMFIISSNHKNDHCAKTQLVNILGPQQGAEEGQAQPAQRGLAVL